MMVDWNQNYTKKEIILASKLWNFHFNVININFMYAIASWLTVIEYPFLRCRWVGSNCHGYNPDPFSPTVNDRIKLITGFVRALATQRVPHRTGSANFSGALKFTQIYLFFVCLSITFEAMSFPISSFSLWVWMSLWYSVPNLYEY